MSGGRLHTTSGTKFTLKQTEGSPREKKEAWSLYCSMWRCCYPSYDHYNIKGLRFQNFLWFCEIIFRSPLISRSVTDYYFFLLLGLRLKDLLIGLGINPLVFLCLGFLNRMPRNTISKMKIRVSITAGPILVWRFLANLLPRWGLFSIIWKILGDYLKLKIGKNRRVGFSPKQELKWSFQQGLLGDFTTC